MAKNKNKVNLIGQISGEIKKSKKLKKCLNCDEMKDNLNISIRLIEKV